jgi:hypothetical protein
MVKKAHKGKVILTIILINLCTTIAKWVPLGRHKSPLGECKQGTMMKRIGM